MTSGGMYIEGRVGGAGSAGSGEMLGEYGHMADDVAEGAGDVAWRFMEGESSRSSSLAKEEVGDVPCSHEASRAEFDGCSRAAESGKACRPSSSEASKVQLGS